jgi:hypothetical protein
VLLVIVGAGASHQCLPQDIDSRLATKREREYRDHLPPLAQNLFDQRDSFGAVLRRHQECANIVGNLRRVLRANSEASIEQELEKIQEEAKDYPPYRVALIEIRRYLQEILGQCGDWILDASNGDTNYAELVTRIGKWRYRSQEPVAIVNFNYDTILDRALETNAGLDLRWMDAYTTGEWKYLKLHGSVNWYRRVPQPDDVWQVHDLKSATKFFAETADKDDGSEGFDAEDYLIAPPGSIDDGWGDWKNVPKPAVAIPYERKAAFECPREHLEELDDFLHQTISILVIGWRGSEQHFLDHVEANVQGKGPAVLIVSNGGEGAQMTMDNLTNGAKLLSADGRARFFTGGFRKFLATDLLDSFLEDPFATVGRESGG